MSTLRTMGGCAHLFLPGSPKHDASLRVYMTGESTEVSIVVRRVGGDSESLCLVPFFISAWLVGPGRGADVVHGALPLEGALIDVKLWICLRAKAARHVAPDATIVTVGNTRYAALFVHFKIYDTQIAHTLERPTPRNARKMVEVWLARDPPAPPTKVHHLPTIL